MIRLIKTHISDKLPRLLHYFKRKRKIQKKILGCSIITNLEFLCSSLHYLVRGCASVGRRLRRFEDLRGSHYVFNGKKNSFKRWNPQQRGFNLGSSLLQLNIYHYCLIEHPCDSVKLQLALQVQELNRRRDNRVVSRTKNLNTGANKDCPGFKMKRTNFYIMK